MVGRCSPVKLPKNTGHSERSEAESKNLFEYSEERPCEAQVIFLFSSVLEEILRSQAPSE